MQAAGGTDSPLAANRAHGRDEEESGLSGIRTTASLTPVESVNEPQRHAEGRAETTAPDESAATQRVAATQTTDMAAFIPVMKEMEDVTIPMQNRPDDETESQAYSTQREIETLLASGHQALSEDRLLIPSDNNAYYYYRKVLALEPGHREAGAGIERIVRRYTLFARRALDRGDTDSAEKYINRGLRIQAQNRTLLALRERMNLHLAQLEAESVHPLDPAPRQVVEVSGRKPTDLVSRLKAFFSKARQQDSDNNDLWVD